MICIALLSTLVLPVFICPVAMSEAQTSEVDCKGDTVDRLGPEIASQSRAFLDQLKVAVRLGHHGKVATLVHYPLRVFVGDREVIVKDRAEFKRTYDKIITPSVKKALEDQSPKCLFGNTKGFMVGDGEIWFTKGAQNLYQIISINTNVMTP